MKILNKATVQRLSANEDTHCYSKGSRNIKIVTEIDKSSLTEQTESIDYIWYQLNVQQRQATAQELPHKVILQWLVE